MEQLKEKSVMVEKKKKKAKRTEKGPVKIDCSYLYEEDLQEELYTRQGRERLVDREVYG